MRFLAINCNFVLILSSYKVNCAVGTYLNTSMGECLDCLKGSYQQSEAQLHCNLCPAGMSTVGVRASNVSECKGKAYSNTVF